MEIAIGIGIGVVIGLVANRHKKSRQVQHVTSATASEEKSRLQKADEELITVILPTINNDK